MSTGTKPRRPSRNELSFAVGAPGGPRSQFWTVWAKAGSSDVYLRAIRGQDLKVSLHDPAKGKAGRPWVFAATDEYMQRYNDPARTPEKVIARWGPFGGYPPGTVEAVRVLFPAGELWTADHALAPPPDTRWSDDADEGYARTFTIAFEPSPFDESSGPGLWRHELSNGRVAILREGTAEMTALLSRTLELKRAHLFEAWLRDVADGRVDPGAPGRHAAAGLHALPLEGHRLTILEWNAAAYWLSDDVGQAP